MKQFFDERVLGARGITGVREDKSGGARKRVGGISSEGDGRYLDLFSRIGFLRAGGNGISGFHVPRQLH